MGKRGRGNRGGGPADDQYGEIGGQDRGGGDHHHHGSGRGGGTAGGGSRGGGGGGGGGGESLTYVRQVPKFLQGYAQLLGGSNNAARGLPADGDELLDGKTVVREEATRDKKRKKFDDDDGDAGLDEEEALDALDRADALAAALRENPQLAEEHPELRAAAAKTLAEEEKQRGNEAMRAGDAEGAVKHYSRALGAVQAGGTGGDAASASASASASSSLSEATSVYYSNRSAAFASLKRWEEALADAGAAVRARPRWHKAHVRVGEAARGLGRPGEAAEAFARALALSPGDEGVAAALFAARAAEAKAVAERAHKFVGGGGGGGGGSSLKRKAAGEGGGGGGRGGGGSGGEKKEAKAGRLSFAADEEEEEEEDDDEEGG